VKTTCTHKRDVKTGSHRLKGHGNEADFRGFLQKSVPHESLTLTFEPFRIWLRIAEIFVIEKRISDSPSRESRRLLHFGESVSRRLTDSANRESANEFLKEKNLIILSVVVTQKPCPVILLGFYSLVR
jgi:hypothetical protein